MSQMQNPREIALSAHRDYYTQGTYDDDRLNWTIETFLSGTDLGKVLEVGCGDGAMLRLLVNRGIAAVGVDASSSGIERCLAQGLSAECLDVSADALPFSDDEFNVVTSLETFEHLMNPHYALREVRRVLRPGGRFICSIPNPLTGHPYLYPGLFEYAYFCRFLHQSGFVIDRVAHWQWAPRETILPDSFRKIPLLRSRIVAGGIRKLIERAYLAAGAFPAFCYWLWTFDCRNEKTGRADIFQEVSGQTRPGSKSHFTAVK
jgi:SAM-dependent methyltransferase